MVHCGYDPSGALGTNYQRGDNWKNFKYNFCAAAQAVPRRAARCNAFNGCLHRQGPSRRSQGRDQCRPGRREVRLPEQRARRQRRRLVRQRRHLPAGRPAGQDSRGQSRRPSSLRPVSLSLSTDEDALSLPPIASTASTAAPARATRRGARSPASGIPTWLAQPAALVPNCKLLDCPPHDIDIKQCLEEAKGYDHVIIHTSHAVAEERLQGRRGHQAEPPGDQDRLCRRARRGAARPRR